MDKKTIAKALIAGSEHLVLATADESGKPWVSPVSYSADEHNNLYWVSSKHALHSKNIRARKEVAATMFGAPKDHDSIEGVYIDGVASELNDTISAEKALESYCQIEQPPHFAIQSVNDVLDESAWRIYKVAPTTISIRVRVVDASSGQAVTEREEVELN